MPDGLYEFSGQPVRVSGGRAYLTDGTTANGLSDTLAGSTLTMDQAVRTMVHEAGAPLTQAAQMASLNAARVLKMKHCRGILAVGKNADIVVMDKGLHVQMTVKAGRVLFCDPASNIGLQPDEAVQRTPST